MFSKNGYMFFPKPIFKQRLFLTKPFYFSLYLLQRTIFNSNLKNSQQRFKFHIILRLLFVCNCTRVRQLTGIWQPQSNQYDDMAQFQTAPIVI